MIERKFVAQKIKEYEIQEYLSSSLKNVGHSHTKMVKTPLGEKIVIYASRPGLVVGKKGQNIKLLTTTLKKRFNLENPQIEISDVDNPNLDAGIVAEKIVDSMEHFGLNKFKAIGHKVMSDVMNSGALGIEIIVSGKVPSDRAKSWRFYSGYLKKCGDVALTGVHKVDMQAHLKTGVVGIKVSIMPPYTKRPDDIHIIDRKEQEQNEQQKAGGQQASTGASEKKNDDAKKSEHLESKEGGLQRKIQKEPKKSQSKKPRRKKNENQGIKVD